MAFATLGCKVNQYDTEGLAQAFRAQGFDVVPFEGPADLYVVNTCAVTGTGARKSRQVIRRAARRGAEQGAPVVVTGCLAQVEAEALAAIPGVRLVVGPDRRRDLAELAVGLLEGRVARRTAPSGDEPEGARARVEVSARIRGNVPAFDELPIHSFHGHVRAVVKVQDGCDEMCTFCIVPHTRGRSRSREPSAVVAEIRRLAAAGYREIVLSGIHLGAYGQEQGRGRDGLVELLDHIDPVVRETGLRVRLSSILPGDVTPLLAAGFARYRWLCPHLHLSVQSGDDAVLRAMGRRYTAQDILEAVTAVRRHRPDVALYGDVIAGFPGESPSAFARTMAFLETIAFAGLHVFPYSPRPGTPAARLERVRPSEVRARAAALLALSRRLRQAFHDRLVGHRVDVLVEHPRRRAGEGVVGVEEHHVRVLLAPGASGDDGRQPGSLVRARVTSAGCQRVLAVQESHAGRRSQ